MQQTDFEPRRRRWPFILVVLLLLVGGLWTWAWHYAAATLETTVAGWKEREAKSGRVYTCAKQSIGGYPFRLEVECADAGVVLSSNQPPLAVRTVVIQIVAQVWQPTVLTSSFTGPLAFGEPGQSATIMANWRSAQMHMHGLPIVPERVSIVLEQPTVDRAEGVSNQRLFNAGRLEINGRMLEGSARANPVIEMALKLVAASAPTLHPAAAIPLDADITAVLLGLKDFSPKPWPERFRELQAANGRIEITNARVQQGDTIATANGNLGLSPRGRLDGQLRLTVANLEKLLPTLGLDKMMAPPPTANPRGPMGALDRISPGLGNIARQNAGPALIAGLNFIGQPAELEGKRAVTLPLRFVEGLVSLGPIPLGQTAPLF